MRYSLSSLEKSGSPFWEVEAVSSSWSLIVISLSALCVGSAEQGDFVWDARAAIVGAVTGLLCDTMVDINPGGV